MLKILLSIVLIASLAVLGSKHVYSRLNIPMGLRNFLSYGTEYIFIGIILGPYFIDILTPELRSNLYPLVSLGLGWIGFIFGSQLQLKRLGRYPAVYYAVTLFQGIFTGAFVFVSFLFAFRELGLMSGYTFVIPALVTVALSASSTNHPAVFHIQQTQYAKTTTLKFMKFVSSLDDIVAIGGFGVLFAYFHRSAEGVGLSGTVIFILSVGLALLFGYILRLLLVLETTRTETFLIVLGSVIFASGTAGYLHISPLFVTFIIGVVIANFSEEREKVFDIAVGAEKPVYIIFLILAGSMWRFENLYLVGILLLVYLITRAVGKIGGNLIPLSLFGFDKSYRRTMGVGMMSQGGLAVALVVNYMQVYGSGISNVILTTLLLALIINELAGPTVLKLYLKFIDGGN